MLTRMRSLAYFPFAGAKLEPGDEFDANEQEKRVLIALGRAEPCKVERKKRKYTRRQLKPNLDYITK